VIRNGDQSEKAQGKKEIFRRNMNVEGTKHHARYCLGAKHATARFAGAEIVSKKGWKKVEAKRRLNRLRLAIVGRKAECGQKKEGRNRKVRWRDSLLRQGRERKTAKSGRK